MQWVLADSQADEPVNPPPDEFWRAVDQLGADLVALRDLAKVMLNEQPKRRRWWWRSGRRSHARAPASPQAALRPHEVGKGQETSGHVG